MKHALIPILMVLTIVVSCVPGRRFQEVQTEAQLNAKKNQELTLTNEELRQQLDEYRAGDGVWQKEFDRLKKDTALLGNSLRRITVQYDKINELNEQLMRKQSSLMSDSESEKKQLLDNLLILQRDLQVKEDKLSTLERELGEKSRALEVREQRVNELEALLASKDEAVRSLKNRVYDALLNFKDKGLTVEEKDGRVYVSLEAKLLFASGSTAVSPEGKSAIMKLTKAIENERDLSVLVEGHTDTDKIIGNTASYKDNWDLSVLRATSVVRIMMDNSSMDPTQVTAAGRSEYLPLDPSDKAKNRRIEIILAPDLDELYKLLEEN